MEYFILITALNILNAYLWYKIGFNKREEIFQTKPKEFCVNNKPVLFVETKGGRYGYEVTVFDTNFVTVTIKK